MWFVALLAVLAAGVPADAEPGFTRPADPRREQLLQVLQGDADAATRINAAMELTRFHKADAEAISALAEVLAHDDSELMRQGAALALLSLWGNAVGALPALQKAIETDSAAVAEICIRAVGGIGPPAKDAVPALVAATFEEENGLAPWAHGALIAVTGEGDEHVAALISYLGDADLREAALVELGGAGPIAADAVPAVVELLDDEDLGIRLLAFRAIRLIASHAEIAVPALSAVANGPRRLADSMDVREAALGALEAFRQSPEAKEAIYQVAEEGELSLRVAAISGLAAVGAEGKRFDRLLLESLEGIWVTDAALKVLIGMEQPPPEALEELRRLATYPLIPEHFAIRAIGTIARDHEPAVAALEAVLDVAWSRANRPNYQQNGGGPVVELRPVSTSTRGRVNTAVVELGKVGAPAESVLPKLRRLIEEPRPGLDDEYTRRLVEEAIASIEADVRARAATAPPAED